MSLNFADFYYMGIAWDKDAFSARPLEKIKNRTDVFLGDTNLTEKIVFKHEEGIVLKDLMHSGYTALKLCSNKFIGILEEHDFKGWSTFPVKLYDRFNNQLEGYHGFSVTGRAGPVDHKKSQLVMPPPPIPTGKTRPVKLGLYFKPENWDGSDIFTLESTTRIIVTAEVKQCIEENNITNVHFKKLTEVYNRIRT